MSSLLFLECGLVPFLWLDPINPWSSLVIHLNARLSRRLGCSPYYHTANGTLDDLVWSFFSTLGSLSALVAHHICFYIQQSLNLDLYLFKYFKSLNLSCKKTPYCLTKKDQFDKKQVLILSFVCFALSLILLVK